MVMIGRFPRTFPNPATSSSTDSLTLYSTCIGAGVSMWCVQRLRLSQSRRTHDDVFREQLQL